MRLHHTVGARFGARFEERSKLNFLLVATVKLGHITKELSFYSRNVVCT